MGAFRDGRLRFLVSTDVLGRGVDFPGEIETYVHRVGRTGRNGQLGTSISFFEPQPWYPHLAHELADVLRQCGQEVPLALVDEENQERSCSQQEWGAGTWPRDSPWQGGAPHHSLPEPPPLEERGEPPLATAEELCEWDACGARVWGYSANGGQSEQGRLELRTGGLLRTSWGWGEWELIHPPPAREPPPLPAALPATAPPAAATEPPGPAPAAPAAAPAAPAAPPRVPHLALTWNGVTDVVMLDPSGLAFDLTSRNGRPSSSYKKTTLGRAMYGVSL